MYEEYVNAASGYRGAVFNFHGRGAACPDGSPNRETRQGETRRGVATLSSLVQPCPALSSLLGDGRTANGDGHGNIGAGADGGGGGVRRSGWRGWMAWLNGVVGWRRDGDGNQRRGQPHS